MRVYRKDICLNLSAIKHLINQNIMTKNLLRFRAIETVFDRDKDKVVKQESKKITDYFAMNVFTLETMRDFLSDDVYENVLISIKSGRQIDRVMADHIAAAMKAWALSKGCTHFTHWFQPLTGATAEKHDTFFTISSNGKAIENFSGGELVQQEPDASSFPSGGLRTTFEARGYTAWDPTSPAFLMEIGEGKTLCIPTIFITYTGEALDYKAPLLKSMNCLEEAALPVCHLFDRNVNKVFPTLGWEQEYFLVDEALFYARPDLVMTGRTLFGNPPAKGQQLDDHYFGTIPERAYSFMRDFEKEVLKLGIPVTTRHNEVAPSQFECAPIFEELNIAVDHNSLLMDVMDRIARKHHLRVLLHEKPYAGVNGSGKHNNWSMGTDNGKNLLSPGKTPKNRLQFLTFFVNTIKAVYDNADLLRASIASAGNDFRLGANEAPPAIISVFIGTLLEEVLQDIQDRVGDSTKFTEAFKSDLKIDLHNKIPNLFKDNTDRNRTSPFAFTGNKFEFRAVGSTANCAEPMIVLNAIVAKQLKSFKKNVDALIKEGYKKDGAILKELSNCIKSSKSIVFGGDGYSDEWVTEAEKRGLRNVKDTPRALDAYVDAKFIKLFKECKIFSESELHARHEILLENYLIKNQIEAKVAEEIAMSQILPAAIDYQNRILGNITSAKNIGLVDPSLDVKSELYTNIANGIKGIVKSVEKINTDMEFADSKDETRSSAIAYYDRVKASVEELREHVDFLEKWVDDESWPLPKYRELLFIR